MDELVAACVGEIGALTDKDAAMDRGSLASANYSYVAE